MPPRARKIAAVSDSPSIGINLDSLEREDVPREPFAVILGGKRYLMRETASIEWKSLIQALGNPAVFFNNVLEEKDRPDFYKQDIPMWKMNALMKAYYEHFGMPAGPESGALPTS